MEKTRYTVMLDFYIHADSDREAVEIAHEIAKKQRFKRDNQARVCEVHKTPFASLETTKLNLNNY